MMYSREEYLKMLQKDLQRLQTISTNTDAEKNEVVGAGVTVKTTIGNKTTVAQVTQKSMENVTSSIGCLDFSRAGDPHVPDGTYVDGVRVKEETVDSEANEDLEILQKDLKRIKNNIVNAAKSADLITPNSSLSETKALENSPSSTTKIVSIIGNKKIENEFKKGQAFTMETAIGPNANFTKINDVKVNHNSTLFCSPDQSNEVDHPSSLTESNDFSHAPFQAPSGPGR